ncbi:glutathione S-transferase N-terminal domain-containing protein [Bordetella hinzii]|uniref:glutathione S-transferase family protein n=1 Tax=Bordetella hinzii TaxID=103855 RepID=UPI002A1886EA|nr:glutathione S-transferase N-terminal domain-containing protein [Bordetella hinzii]WPL80782.1 glutathione S-transferase N-terminal domain-containing protein [Bordetella hinzii]
MSRWTFYTAPGTCALATHIALHEAGAEFDLVKLDMSANQQQSPAYLSVNPKGRVPALATEHGVLTETPALLAFVAQRFPAAHEAMRAKVPQTMTACAAYLESQIAGPWVAGEAYSAVDGYLFTVGSWLEGDGVDMSRFPKLSAYLARVAARPAVQRALAEAQA